MHFLDYLFHQQLFDLSHAARWLLGIGMVVANSALAASGFILLRKVELISQDQATQKLADEVPQAVTRRQLWMLWAAGIALYIAAAIPDVLSYMLITQIVIGTVGCLRLAFIAALAHSFLQERLGQRQVCGMALCAVGATVCLWFGPESATRSATSPIELLSPKIGAYILVTGTVVIGAMLAGVERIDAFVGRFAPGARYLVLPYLVSQADCLQKVFLTSVGFASSPHELLHEPWWWPLLVVIGSLALIDFYLTLQGVKAMPATIFVPTCFALRTVLLFLQASLVLDEFTELTSHCVLLSLIGAAVALVGALYIQPLAPSTEAGLSCETVLLIGKKL